jgi:hypothetical protein
VAGSWLPLSIAPLVPVGATAAASPFALYKLEPIHVIVPRFLLLFDSWPTSLSNGLAVAQILPVLVYDPAGSSSLSPAESCGETLVLSSGILCSDSEESFVWRGLPEEIVRLGIEADDPARALPRIALHLRLPVDLDPGSR